MTRSRIAGAALACAVFAAPCGLALAQAPASQDTASETETQLQAAFARGVQSQKKQDWAHALAAFQEAAALATGQNVVAIRFNIAVCQRALGHFLAAHQTLVGLMQHADQLEPVRAEQASAYLRELEQLIARVEVELDPPAASLSVDAGPLLRDPSGADRYLAGLSHDAKQITSLNRRSFVIWLDPGAHIFRANRPGHAEAVLVRSYAEGEAAHLQLALDVLPATIAVKSEPAAAIVRIDGREVGVTPLEVQRAAGSYRLEVEQTDYNLHSQKLSLEPGERVDVTAPLTRYETPLTQRWWFWTSIAAAAGLIAVGTYFAVRPGPETPAYEGGNTGWVARAP